MAMLRQLSIGVLLLISFAGCKKAEDRRCLKGVGDVSEEIRNFSSFHRLYLYDYLQYRLIQDSTNKVVIRAGENLLNHVVTDWDNGNLTIRDENKCIWLRQLPVDIEVDVHFTDITHVHNESSGHLEGVGLIKGQDVLYENWNTASTSSLDMEAQILRIKAHAGAPIIEVSGQCDMVYYYNSGIGKLLCEDLVSQSAWTNVRGAGEVRMNIDGGTFWYLLDSYGDIYYRGDTDDFREVSRLGAGQLIHLGD